MGISGTRNITLSGDICSGKTTLANALAERGWHVVSAGSVFRAEAEERGLSLAEFTELCKTDDSVDRALDHRMYALGLNAVHTVFDSRLAFHFVPDALNLFVTCPLDVAAKRLLAAARGGEQFDSLAEAMEGIRRRRDSERVRWREMYGVDIENRSLFDAVVDGSGSPEETLEQVLTLLG